MIMNENVSCTEYHLTTADNSWLPSDSPLATKLLPEYRSRLKTDIFTFKCFICRKKFNSRKKLMLHQTHSHASQDDEDAQKNIKNVAKKRMLDFNHEQSTPASTITTSSKTDQIIQDVGDFDDINIFSSDEDMMGTGSDSNETEWTIDKMISYIFQSTMKNNTSLDCMVTRFDKLENLLNSFIQKLNLLSSNTLDDTITISSSPKIFDSPNTFSSAIYQKNVDKPLSSKISSEPTTISTYSKKLPSSSKHTFHALRSDSKSSTDFKVIPQATSSAPNKVVIDLKNKDCNKVTPQNMVMERMKKCPCVRFIKKEMGKKFTRGELCSGSISGDDIRYKGEIIKKVPLDRDKLDTILLDAQQKFPDVYHSINISEVVHEKCRNVRNYVLKNSIMNPSQVLPSSMQKNINLAPSEKKMDSSLTVTSSKFQSNINTSTPKDIFNTSMSITKSQDVPSSIQMNFNNSTDVIFDSSTLTTSQDVPFSIQTHVNTSTEEVFDSNTIVISSQDIPSSIQTNKQASTENIFDTNMIVITPQDLPSFQTNFNITATDKKMTLTTLQDRPSLVTTKDCHKVASRTSSIEKIKNCPCIRFIKSEMGKKFTREELSNGSIRGEDIKYKGEIIRKIPLDRNKLDAILLDAQNKFPDMYGSLNVNEIVNEKCKSVRNYSYKSSISIPSQDHNLPSMIQPNFITTTEKTFVTSTILNPSQNKVTPRISSMEKIKNCPCIRFIKSEMGKKFTREELSKGSISGNDIKYKGEIIKKVPLDRNKLDAILLDAQNKFPDMYGSLNINEIVNEKCRNIRNYSHKSSILIPSEDGPSMIQPNFNTSSTEEIFDTSTTVCTLKDKP